jgi:hypothetical protein
MLGEKKPSYFVQSKPPNKGIFVHHATYDALKKIVLGYGYLREGGPYKGISLTVDPGRYLSPMPLFTRTVDGFITCSAAPLLEQDLVVPCLYRFTDTDVVDMAREKGYRIFAENEIPPEYKYIKDRVIKRPEFANECEWLHMGANLHISDYKVYIFEPKVHKRFLKSVNYAKNIFLAKDYISGIVMEREKNAQEALKLYDFGDRVTEMGAWEFDGDQARISVLFDKAPLKFFVVKFEKESPDVTESYVA